MIEDTTDVVSTLSPPLTHSLATNRERDALYQKFKERISVNALLDRTLVSYQGNKKRAFYSWFKYKEGFSEALVNYLLRRFEPGVLLDPFSGAGATLFAGSSLGWEAKGIELLPVGIYATRERLRASKIDAQKFRTVLTKLLQADFSDYYHQDYAIKHITITRGAFPLEQEKQLVGYIAYCHEIVEDEDIKNILLYSAFCILEEISYTRKDGQYLRWDARSGRSQGTIPFNKGYIFPFRAAISEKLKQIASDLEAEYTQQLLFGDDTPTFTATTPQLYEGSCLFELPKIESSSVDVILTSPPYANRYDYTRTYALELVYLGYSEEQVKYLRQAMLSCTVENKDKRDLLESFYKYLGREVEFYLIDEVFQKQKALHEVLSLLQEYQVQGKLNNPGIITLVHHYFYEMCFVIYELARVLRPGGTAIIVNDNVRYAGEEVPVDLILSNIAEDFGLKTKHIWTLQRGKGNSSQQMGSHGRSELRKCIYVWEKEASMSKTRDQLLIEAHQINYRLRSTFFYRKIKEYNILALPAMIANLASLDQLYSWDGRADWGIGDDAYNYILSHPELKRIQVFCHPKLLREYPMVLAYYRNIAALSQKAVNYLVGVNVTKYEDARQENKIFVNDQHIFLLTKLFNEHISLIVDSSIQSLNEQELHGLLLASTGAQIDGAWRNAIGDEAEKVVQRLLVKEAIKQNLLSAFITYARTPPEPFTMERMDEQLENIGLYRGIMLRNQTSVIFSREPDISLIGKQGTTIGVIEVKGGTDPAGALERYGAAKKSFEDALRNAPDAKTILIASCITPEARERIDKDSTVSVYFNLTEIINEKKRYNELIESIFSVLSTD